MALSVILKVTALMTSLVALAVSGRLALRQVQVAERSNNAAVVLKLFEVARGEEFVETQKYAREKLADKHEAALGITGLPEDLRHRMTLLTWFYDDLGKLVAQGAVAEDVVLGVFGAGVLRTWDALAPYVYAERQLRATNFQMYFEDLAARSAARTPQDVGRTLGPRARPQGYRSSEGESD